MTCGTLVAMTNDQHPLGIRMRTARNHRQLSLDDLAYGVRTLLPERRSVTKETLRKYEVGTVAESVVDEVIVAAVAVVLDIPLEDLSPDVALARDRVRDLLVSSRCFPTSPQAEAVSA